MFQHLTIPILLIAPSGKPHNVSGYSLNSTSIHLEWSTVNCSEQNGNIMGYEIHYQPLEYPQLELTETVTTNEQTMLFTATHLIPLTDYMFSVSAMNTNGTGPNETITVTTVAIEGKHNNCFMQFYCTTSYSFNCRNKTLSWWLFSN